MKFHFYSCLAVPVSTSGPNVNTVHIKIAAEVNSEPQDEPMSDDEQVSDLIL